MSRRALAIPAVLAVAAIIAVLTLTPGPGATASPDASAWGRVSCLTCSPTWLADVFGNVALFMPLGAALALAGVSPVRALLLGAAASLGIEVLQFVNLPAGRTPALADLASNACGTWIGALCAWHRVRLLAPSATQARVLQRAWALGVAALLALVAVALSPATPVQPAATPVPSQLPFTPGYGWYAGRISDARVNATPTAHAGSGPVIVALAPADSTMALATVTGIDARTNVVPIMFVHDPRMSTTEPRRTRAHLLLGQHGTAAFLTSELRATRWGLATPALELPDALEPAPRYKVGLVGAITPRHWRLGAGLVNIAHGVHVADLFLSPAIGWVLVQSLLPLRTPWAPVLTAGWLFALFAPLGFWVAAAHAPAPRVRPAIASITWSLVLLAIGWLAARVTGTAPLSPLHAAWCVGCSVLGAVLARPVHRFVSTSSK